MIATLAAVALATVVYDRASSSPMRDAPVGEFGERVLVVVPHPDDEALGAAGTIHDLVSRGASVKVVIMTAGDAYERAARRLARRAPRSLDYVRLGDLRRHEAVRAGEALGLSEADVIGLGYADGSLNSLWDRDWDDAHPHIGRNGSPTVPYAWAYRPGALQCGRELVEDLRSILASFRPTTVITVDPAEVHHDHWACAALTQYALEAADYTGQRRTFLVHYGNYPFPLAYLPKAELSAPGSLVGNGTRWSSIPMDKTDIEAKTACIRSYRSQRAVPDLQWFMFSFIRSNELFGSYEASRVVATPSDAIPDAAHAKVVLSSPPHDWTRGLVPFGAQVSQVLMSRGPRVAWIGLRVRGGVSDTTRYGVGLRLFGGTRAPERIDVFATGHRIELGRLSKDSLTPEGVHTEVAGDTIWFAIPATVLAGRTSAIVGVTGKAEGSRTPFRSPWRIVRF